MNSKIALICILFLTSCSATEDVNEVYNKCFVMKNSAYCANYKLMKIIKKLKMESTTDNIVQNINETDTQSVTEKVNRLLTVLMDLLYSPSNSKVSRNNELVTSASRSSEKVETSLFKGKDS